MSAARPFLPPSPEHDYKHGAKCVEPCGACGDKSPAPKREPRAAYDILVRFTVTGQRSHAGAVKALEALLAKRLDPASEAYSHVLDSWGVAGAGEEPQPIVLLQRAARALRALRLQAVRDADAAFLPDEHEVTTATRVLDAVARAYPAMLPGWVS